MIQATLQELILSDEQLDAISKAMEEQAGYNWCMETLVQIAKNTPDYKENTRLDNILLAIQKAFLIGHRNAMELMRETIRLHTQTTG